VTDVNEQDDADERDRTGNTDHAIRAYASTEKSYFKSLRLRHGLSPSTSDSPAEPVVAIGGSFLNADNSKFVLKLNHVLCQMVTRTAWGSRALGEKPLRAYRREPYAANGRASLRNPCSVLEIERPKCFRR
jgi:hypothetical protein